MLVRMRENALQVLKPIRNYTVKYSHLLRNVIKIFPPQKSRWYFNVLQCSAQIDTLSKIKQFIISFIDLLTLSVKFLIESVTLHSSIELKF